MTNIKKYYSKQENKFYIERVRDNGNSMTFEYASFHEFYCAANEDLSGVDLTEYNFQNVDLSKYNLDTAMISPSIKKQIANRNLQLYKTMVADVEYDKKRQIKGATSQNKTIVCHDALDDNPKNMCFCYISDLHLDMKLLNKYKSAITNNKIREYLSKKIDDLKKSIPTSDDMWSERAYYFYSQIKVIIVGDISCNFEIFKAFFELYKKKISNQTFVVLGNHELWDETVVKECKTLDGIIDKYRQYLSSLNIVLLENQLFLPCEQKQLLDENDIMSMSDLELKKLISRNTYALFGGIGYAGCNECYNFDSGLYRNAPLNRGIEQALSQKTNLLHQKISHAASKAKIIWATHMPKDDWSRDAYNPNWIYVSGHTHKNVFCNDATKCLYSDNQLGYKNQMFGFKQFWLSPFENIFENKEDGVYEIIAPLYKYFYTTLGKSIEFNREFSKLYMVKKSGNYCFLMTTVKSEELKLLAGGQIRNTGHKNIQYFYDNLDNYTQSVKKYMFKYEEYQNKIAQEVVGLGGIGTIHGCIIDIDFFNHLFVNPLDGKITPYYADDMVNKYVYANVPSLLFAQNRGLYDKLMSSTVEDKMNYLIKHDEIISNENIKVADTEIYRISRVISDLQYTTRDSVVRVWYKGILDKSTEENGREIVAQLISLGEAESTK